ncbi:MAG: aldo/keto reductase [Gammaproteobacteria bacterium]|nr:aldo/keto reductase [Gammaproteobacteria bacterium]|tara:strand:- start:526 stop:1302 length:777 start_codon:yes stop_codon:yes gene_type:complete
MSLKKRKLGQTDLSISSLGLGTVKFGRTEQVKYPNTYSLPSDEQVADLLDQAKSFGINLLDTAPAYGSSEERLGRLLAGRQDWVICTKVGEEFINGKSVYNFSADYTKKSVERSLINLKTDYLDIVLIHSNGHDIDIIESTDCLSTLQKLKEKGTIRAIGMSTKSVEGGIKAADLTDLVMVTYNPISTEEGIVINHANNKNKGVLIKKALNSGHICEDAFKKNFDFVLNKEGVSSVIIGTVNPEHLQTNVQIVENILR